jgi:glutathione synthase/RimK-type ligase-like ATP-grasp enzyme
LHGPAGSGFIRGADWTVDLDELTGVFVRYLGAEGRIRHAQLTPESAPPMYFEYDTGLMALLEDLPCPVVNRVAGGMSNSSKAYQALLVRDCGLLTPPTLVSNDPVAVQSFLDDWDGEVIYKSLSGVRSIVRRMSSTQVERLALLRHGPAQFQSLIKGENIRVHTVGDQVFPTRVHSDAVDYRYAGREGGSVAMEPTEVPVPVAEACLRLARKLDLVLAGIDLMETPQGDYYCFEVNPSPGFLYYEQHTGQAISAAVAELLHAG